MKYHNFLTELNFSGRLLIPLGTAGNVLGYGLQQVKIAVSSQDIAIVDRNVKTK